MREELFQFLVRLENSVLHHVLDRLDRPDALARHLLIAMDSERASGDSPAWPALFVVIPPSSDETYQCPHNPQAEGKTRNELPLPIVVKRC